MYFFPVYEEKSYNNSIHVRLHIHNENFIVYTHKENFVGKIVIKFCTREIYYDIDQHYALIDLYPFISYKRYTEKKILESLLLKYKVNFAEIPHK